MYRQIKSMILAAISNEVFRSGEIFPSEVKLAKMMGVTRVTVRQATNELVAEGALIREKGKQPRVAKPKTVARFLELGGISHYVSDDDGKYVCRVIQAEYQRVSSAIAQALEIHKGSLVFALERLRSDENVIFGWKKTWINKRLFPGIENHVFFVESLYRVLKNNYKIVPSHAEGVIEVLVANSIQAKMFEAREGMPLLSVHRTVYTKNNRPIQVNHEIYRGDCHSFAFTAGNRR